MPLVSKSFSDIITFSRGTNATYFDSAGVLKYAPNNLLTYSEAFDTNPDWTKSGSSITADAVISPAGTLTADTLVESNLNEGHFIYPSVSWVSGTTYVLSIYAKQNSPSRYLSLCQRSGVVFASNAGAVFDLTLGTVTTNSLGAGNADIIPAGNGWYRCWIKVTPNATATTSGVNIRLSDDNATVVDSYLGDGTSGIYIWGAQLNIGDLQSYYPTQATAYYGPRFDYNPSTLAAQGLLIEEQRTNIFTYSEDFQDTAEAGGTRPWINVDTTITTDSTVAPDGATTADLVIADATSALHGRRQGYTGTTNATYTYTVYAKQGAGTYDFAIQVASNTATAAFNAGNRVTARYDISAGTVISIGTGVGNTSGVSGTITPAGNGWYRCSFTFIPDTTGANAGFTVGFVSIDPAQVPALGWTGDGSSGAYVWGAQLEAGAFPTSYIPTTTTALTRAADVASVNTLSPWYNAAEGTVYAEGITSNLANSPTFVMLHDGTANNRISTLLGASGFGRLEGTVGGAAWTAAVTANSISANTLFKLATAFKAADQAVSLNAGAVSTQTNASMPAVSALRLGAYFTGANFINGYLRRITYYPRRLSNAELVSITS
jgi:hypothetical protein